MSRVGLGASLAAFALYAALALVQWTNAYTPSWDLGIFTQLAKAYADLSAPIVPIKGPGFNLLGDHFHPILVLLAPLYWIHPSGLTLLLAQAFLFAASAYPIGSLAAERLGPKLGALLAFSYPLSWMLVNAQWAQFHEIAFAVPLLAFGLVWWVRGRPLPALTALWLLVFVKEDLGLTVAAFGIAIILQNRANLRAGLASIGWGLAWFVLSTFVILPALNPAGQWDYADNVSLLTQTLAGAGLKATLVAILALTAGIVGLTSPIIIMVLPTLAWRFVGTVEYYWGWEFHYSAVLAPIVFVALLSAIGEPEPPARGGDGEDQASVDSPSPAENPARAGRPTRQFSPGARGRTVAVFTSVAATLAMVPVSHVDLLWNHPSRQDPAPIIADAAGYERVASDITLLAYLAPVTEVYWYGSMGEAQVDAVVLDRWRIDGDPVAWTEERVDGSWRVDTMTDDWVLLVRAQ